MYNDYTAFCTFFDSDTNRIFEHDLTFTSKADEIETTLISEIIFFTKMRREHHNQNVSLFNKTINVVGNVSFRYIDTEITIDNMGNIL